jgi:hypothetical protein
MATRFLFGGTKPVVIEGTGAGRRRDAKAPRIIYEERMRMPFKREVWMRNTAIAVATLGTLALGACSSGAPKTFHTQEEGGFSPFGLFGGGRSAKATAEQPAIGVNGYLWRASLDTLSFMPLASADPYGGVIITDWYVNPERPEERFKCTVYILDSRLRADGLNVAVFKQARDGAGGWVDAPSAGQTETDIENAILTKARQLRLSNIRG